MNRANELRRVMHAISGIRVEDYDVDFALRIIETILVELNISPELFTSLGRTREASEARFIAVYLIKKNTELKLKPIAKLIGNRDHSTVLYCFDTAKDLLETNKVFAEKLKIVERKLKEQ